MFRLSNLENKKIEDEDYAKLKNMVKNINKLDIKDVQKRQRWVQDQKSKINAKQRLKEAMSYQPMKIDETSSNMTYSKGIGHALAASHNQYQFTATVDHRGSQDNISEIDEISMNDDQDIELHPNSKLNKDIKSIPTLKKMATLTKKFSDYPKNYKMASITKS